MGAVTNFPPATPIADIIASAKLPTKLNQQYQQCEDNISTDSSSFNDDETKKRKRKLFSFGKKSSKVKVKNS